MKKQLAELLYDLGFLGSRSPKDHHANINSGQYYVGVTIGSQNDYWDTIAEILIAILLLLQGAIAVHSDNYWRQLFLSRNSAFLP